MMRSICVSPAVICSNSLPLFPCTPESSHVGNIVPQNQMLRIFLQVLSFEFRVFCRSNRKWMETLIMEAVPSFKHEAGRDSLLVCVLSYGLICRRVGQKKGRHSVAIECSKCCVTYFYI